MKAIEVSEELLNQLENIQWFVNCGSREELDLSCSLQYVNGWEKAEEYDDKEEWEEVISESREKLVSFVISKLGYSVREFNSTVALVRESHQYKSAVSELYDVIEEKSIKEEFGDTLGWLLLNAGVESAFADYKGCPKFFSEVLLVIKNGHCPCGWEGRWPKGTLYIY